MKKLILCLFAVSMMAFVSCSKEKETPANEWVGNYSLAVTVSFDDVPVIGSITRDYDLQATVKATGENTVEMSMGEQKATGYVADDGLHVDPIMIDYPLFGTTTAKVRVVTPVVPPLQNGKTSTVAELSTSVSGITIYGTADVDATKK